MCASTVGWRSAGSSIAALRRARFVLAQYARVVSGSMRRFATMLSPPGTSRLASSYMRNGPAFIERRRRIE